MLRLDGVNQRAVVSLSAAPLGSGKTDCALPFPYVVVPTITARSWSCSAPATISDALALDPLTSAMSRRSAQCCATLSANERTLPGARPRIVTIFCPGSRKRSLTSTPCCSRPPGSLRRSMISVFIPASRRLSIARRRSDAVSSLNTVRLRYPVLALSIETCRTERTRMSARVSAEREAGSPRPAARRPPSTWCRAHRGCSSAPRRASSLRSTAHRSTRCGRRSPVRRAPPACRAEASRR